MRRTLLFCLMTAAFCRAQSTDAVLSGRVLDPAGLAVPGAEVRAKAENRDLQRTVRSGAQGHFRLDALPAGVYQVLVEKTGFARHELARVELQVRQVVELEIRLVLGGRNETIRVEGQVTPLDAAPASMGFAVAESQVRALPLAVRNFIGLATLGPGVIPRHLTGNVHDVNTDVQPGRGNTALSPVVNGIRSQSNTFLLDGILNTDGNVNAFVVSPPLESIQEFRLQTSMASAEFGYSGGGVINVVTRSGGPKFHAGIFDFFRNQVLDAHGYFDQPGPRPAFRQQQFGGQAGGPVFALPGWFFFASYEGLRSTLGHSKHVTVPGANLRSGDFFGLDPIGDPRSGQPFPNNRIPAERIDPAARTFLDKFQPLPNGPDSQLLDTTPDRRSADTGSLRLDRNTSRWGSVFGRYTINDDRATIAANFPVLPNDERIRAQQLTLAHTYAGQDLINEARLGFNRLAVSELPKSAFVRDVIGELGIGGIDRDPINYGLPIINTGNFTLLVDDPTLPQAQHDVTYQVMDQFTVKRGRHTLAMGGEFRRFLMNFLQRQNSRGIFNFGGAYTGNNFADFLLGLPATTERSAGRPQAYLRRLAYAWFVQDEVRVRPGLTLSAGLRYNYSSPFTEKRNNLFNLDYSKLPAAPVLVQSSLVNADRDDFAPRFGLAWQPHRGGGRLLFRGGYGIFHSPEIAVEAYDLVRNGIRNEKNVAPAGPPVLTLTNGFPAGLNTGLPSYFGLDRNLPTPYVQQWNAGWQVGLKSMLLEVAYIGAKGTHLGRFRTFNTPQQVELGKNLPPRPGDLQALRSSPTLGPIIQRQHIANSIYHSLQLRAEKRFSRGLQFQGSYTWAKSIDDADSVIPGKYGSFGAQDERNLRLERGLSFFDVRQRLTFNALYDLPFGKGRRWASSGVAAQVLGGWRFGGIALLQAGTPANPVYFFRDFANTGTPNRPNVVPGVKVTLPRNERTPERFFNPAAFSDPAPFTFGNAGRNILPGPGVALFDLALHRTFSLGESRNLEFRTEFFNVFNHPNLGVPGPYPDFGPFFGKIFTVGEPRRVQLALKLGF